MKRIWILAVILVSCGTANVSHGKKKSANKVITQNRNLKSNFRDKKKSALTSKILNNAENYLGVPYKLGGTTSSGMDCSGLVVRVFEENNLKMPRRSAEQAKEGRLINIKEVREGDLLFFATAGRNEVSHIGIAHKIEQNGEIKFIHASTRRGVIISSLEEVYWNKAFLFARRVLA